MDIVLYPNEVLKRKSEPVLEFDSTLHQTLDEMAATMLKANGLGLSAIQVSIPLSLFIMKDNKGKIHEFINPVITDSEGTIVASEGCLSAPGVYLPIGRAEAVYVTYQDRNGEQRRLVAEGIEARIIQHEMDHLSGNFYFDKVNRALRKRAIAQLKKIR